MAQVLARVREEAGKAAKGGSVSPDRRARGAEPAAAPKVAMPDPKDPTLWPQREALKAALQFPAFAGPVFDSLTADSFTHPGYVAVRTAIEAAGGAAAGIVGAEWIDKVRQSASSQNQVMLINALTAEAIQVDSDERLPRYIGSVLAKLQEVWVGRQVAEVKSKLQRMSPVEHADEYHALFGDLVALEAYRRSLLEQVSGDDLSV